MMDSINNIHNEHNVQDVPHKHISGKDIRGKAGKPRLRVAKSKVFYITALLFGFMLVLTFPLRSYSHNADSDSSDGYTGFSGAETYTDSSGNNTYRFGWAGADARLEYPLMSRYSSLHLRLRLNLQRPAGQPPAHIEVYTSPLTVEDAPLQLLTTIDAGPNDTGPRDYDLTIPTLSSGTGVAIEFHTNTFSPPGDHRQLGFIFVESQLSLPLTHWLNLIWPYPYWPAALILLAVVVAFALRAGFDSLSAGMLGGMLAFGLVSFLPSTYNYSGWLLLLASGLVGIYWASGKRGWRRLSFLWILLGACLIVSMFLITPDAQIYDLKFYRDWSSSIQAHGVWNIYNQTPSLNYLPLIVYFLWFYNLVTYPLGLQNSDTFWQITVSLMFIATVAVAYLIWRRVFKEAPGESASGPLTPQRLVMFGFNIALFYNSTVWGQWDILPTLTLLVSFYLIYRRKWWGSGILLGLTVLAKPQAWFVLPVLAWWLIQRCGWRKGSVGLLVSSVIALGLGGIAFGFDWQSFMVYWNQPQLTGDYSNSIPTAFNLSYLILGNSTQALPTVLTMAGFVLVGLTFLFVLYTSRGRNRSLTEYGAGASLVALACFAFLIKMKERYLLYGLPFLGLAALQKPRWVKPFLLLSSLQILNLITGFYEAGTWGKRGLLNNFYLWAALMSQDLVQRFFSLVMLATFGYLGWLYWQEVEVAPRQTHKELFAQSLPDPNTPADEPAHQPVKSVLK